MTCQKDIRSKMENVQEWGRNNHSRPHVVLPVLLPELRLAWKNLEADAVRKRHPVGALLGDVPIDKWLQWGDDEQGGGGVDRCPLGLLAPFRDRLNTRVLTMSHLGQ